MSDASPLHPDVAAAVASLSLAEPSAPTTAATGRFTVARTEALLRLREIPRAPWEWTIGLLQAALALCRVARAQVVVHEDEVERIVELQFAVPGAALEEALSGVQDLLAAALEEAPQALREPSPEEGVQRWRVAVAAALNAGLARGPTELSVVTPGGARVLRRRDGQPNPGHDAYRERRDPERCPRNAFVVRLREPRPSFGRRLAAFLALRGEVAEEIAATWRRALVLPGDDADVRRGVDLQRRLPGVPNRLGEHALWGMLPELGGPWLVRDGVKIFDLGPVLARRGVDPAHFAGWIDCPTLRLTADLASIAEDHALELLIAWLHDAQAHTFPGQGALPQVIWPDEVKMITAASGRPVPIAQLRYAAQQGADFPYEWPHRRDAVPIRAQARVFAVWPSELAALQRAIPELRPVPHRNLGEHMRQARTDLSGLVERSLPAIQLDLDPPYVELARAEGEPLRVGLDALAYVHRQTTATAGAIVILAYGRRIAQSRDENHSLPGVTLVVTIDAEVAIDELRGDRPALDAILGRSREALEAARERLLAVAFATPSPWEIPLVRGLAAAAAPQALGLTYRLIDGRVVLSWREGQLLGLPIGADQRGAPRLLGDALAALRERGGVVVAKDGRRWAALEPENADEVLWSLTPHGLELCARVLGPRSLWTMPVAVAAQLHVAPAASQRHLLLTRAGRDEHMRKAAKHPRSRAALIAHLLVAQALGEATHGLERDPLFTRYDPRALSPSRLVSYEEIAAADPKPLLCPAGAVHRELPGVVIEATPGEALLLHELLELTPALAADASPGAAASRSERRPAIRRQGHDRAPLVTLPVADEIAAGALRIDDPAPERPAAIALWAGGLHIDDLTLPAPLDCIGGRLWLTRAGLKAGTERLAARLRELARELVRRALAARLLHPPESREAAMIAALIERLRGAPARERGWIADLLPVDPDVPRRQWALARSLERIPLRRLLGGGSERLAQILRQSLGQGVALETAFLSWAPVRILEAPAAADPKSGRWSLELGRRDRWVQAALPREAPLAASFDAAALILAVLLARARHEGLAGCDPVRESIAFYRLLALGFATT
ncbi:MAG: hypothetical protein R3A79_19745 [Nannocystaceae bacterium]